MKTIVINNQKTLDALPDSFAEYTIIEIKNTTETVYVKKARENSSVVAWGNSSVVAWGNSSVEAWENSSVVAWGNSSVEARENSSVEAWENSSVVAWGNSSVEAWENSSVVARGNSSVVAHDFSMIAVLMASVTIKKLLDYSVASLRGFKIKIGQKSKTATVIQTPKRIERSFNEWLKQGYVHADGITRKLLSHKKLGNVEVFEVEEFPSRKSSYVVKRGNVFSHGKTIKEAKDSLKYKIGNRDTSEFKKWTLKTVATQSKMIEAYRAITGACEFGVKGFCEGKKLPIKLSVQKVIELTQGKFGNKQFEEFFTK